MDDEIGASEDKAIGLNEEGFWRTGFLKGFFPHWLG